MNGYKVPQDVEAEDKLLGPFSFRQFIYLMIVAGLIAIAWGLSNIFIGLAFIPSPLIIFFGALALPLRKDQPMETYLAALVNFWTKPRVRLWDSEGVENTIEIMAPKIVDQKLTKEIYGTEAVEKLGYLAQVLDTGGWSAVTSIAPSSAESTKINSDIIAEADAAPDMFGDYDNTSQKINQIIDQRSSQSREALVQKFRQEVSASISQSTEPIESSTPTPAPQTLAQPVNPAIISLANDNTLSVETIAKQANKIVKQSPDEVVISLR